LSAFVGYLLFDVLIGNTDRHHENWGIMVLRDQGRPRLHLAPSFDHASSLGRELADDRRINRLKTNDRRSDMQAYAEKARSAFYGPELSIRTMTSREVAEALLQAFADAARPWCHKIGALEPKVFEGILNDIPENFISVPGRQFACRLLAYNQTVIRELAGG
jgi:hypothetical protein